MRLQARLQMLSEFGNLQARLFRDSAVRDPRPVAGPAIAADQWIVQGCHELLIGIRICGYIFSYEKHRQTVQSLSDETRLRILALLTAGELCVCDLMAVLDLPQSTVSRHLAYLRNAGLVEDRRQGVWMFYRLATPSLRLGEVAAQLPDRLAELESGQRDQVALRAYLADKTAAGCN